MVLKGTLHITVIEGNDTSGKAAGRTAFSCSLMIKAMGWCYGWQCTMRSGRLGYARCVEKERHQQSQNNTNGQDEVDGFVLFCDIRHGPVHGFTDYLGCSCNLYRRHSPMTKYLKAAIPISPRQSDQWLGPQWQMFFSPFANKRFPGQFRIRLQQGC